MKRAFGLRISNLGTKRPRWSEFGVLLALLLAWAVACGGIRTISRDGYRALIVFGGQEKYSIALRGEKRRVEGDFDGSKLVKILRPDLGKTWQFRPSTKKLLEEPWQPTDEIVPGYPLEPAFDPQAYADRFHAKVQRIDDGIHGIHPCERYSFALPSGDFVTLWVARDLERLPVKVEHEKKKDEELAPFKVVELLDIRIGADPDLFDKPKGYVPVRSYEELAR
jgi:hypothetical protein